MIQYVTLGVAAAEANNKVREEGGNNRGARVREYLANVEPPMAEGAPWCAAFVQYCSDVAGRSIGVASPLDAVKLEALVQNYYDTFKAKVVDKPLPGDLVLFKFQKSETWNHIGIVASSPRPGMTIFYAIEGNTGDVNQRDGDGVYLKPRDSTKQPTCFIRWAT